MLLAGLVVAAACSSSTSAALEAPPELEPAPFEVQPEVATAGGTVAISYPDPLITPAGFYFLHQWTAEGWSEPTHLIETDSNGSPKIFTAGVDVFEIEGYEAGPSPATAPIPDVPAGFWMLCETNKTDTACVSIEITEP